MLKGRIVYFANKRKPSTEQKSITNLLVAFERKNGKKSNNTSFDRAAIAVIKSYFSYQSLATIRKKLQKQIHHFKTNTSLDSGFRVRYGYENTIRSIFISITQTPQ